MQTNIMEWLNRAQNRPSNPDSQLKLVSGKLCVKGSMHIGGTTAHILQPSPPLHRTQGCIRERPGVICPCTVCVGIAPVYDLQHDLLVNLHPDCDFTSAAIDRKSVV